MFESESMFNSKLQPMFNGSVLMNDKAIHDQAVMNALQSFAEDNFEFKLTFRLKLEFDFDLKWELKLLKFQLITSKFKASGVRFGPQGCHFGNQK